MKKILRVCSYLIFGVGCLLLFCPQQVLAAIVTLEVQNGTAPGFGFSNVHNATKSKEIGGTTYYIGGSKILTELHGDLMAALDGSNNLSGINGNLSGGPGEGSLDIKSGFFNQNADGAGVLGKLEYDLFDASNAQVDWGTFWFFDDNFHGSPNSFQNSSGDLVLDLWGNNWDNKNGPIPSFRLGLDLRATVVETSPVVPIPGAVWLFGSSLAALAACRKKNKALFV